MLDNGIDLHNIAYKKPASKMVINFFTFLLTNKFFFLQDICSEIAFTVYAENIILQKENIQMYNLVEITTQGWWGFLKHKMKTRREKTKKQNKTKQKHYTNFSPFHPSPCMALFPLIYTSTQSLHSLPTPIRTHLYLRKPIQHSQQNKTKIRWSLMCFLLIF